MNIHHILKHKYFKTIIHKITIKKTNKLSPDHKKKKYMKFKYRSFE